MRLFALRVSAAAVLVALITGWFWVGRAIEASTHGAVNAILTVGYAFVLIVLFTMLWRVAWATIKDAVTAAAARVGSRYQTR